MVSSWKALFLLFFLFLISAGVARAEEVDVYPVRVHIFYLKTCPHCHDEIKFMNKLKQEYPHLEVYTYEVSDSIKNQSLKNNVGKHYDIPRDQQQYVPLTVIGDEYHVGYDSDDETGAEFEKQIQACSIKGCNSWLDGLVNLSKIDEAGKKTIDVDVDLAAMLRADEVIQTPPAPDEGVSATIFGQTWEIGRGTSILLAGFVLGLADGINPCMFSVILFLLTYLLTIGSRQRALKAGIAFIITTFIVYFSFMYGILKVVDVFGLADPMRKVVTIFALVVGLIMIKDYFYYGKGISLDIPKQFRPRIEMLVKKGTILSAVLLALFSSIVELPCTSGLPLAYATILRNNEADAFFYLVWYNLFFVLPLVVIVGLVIFAWTKVENIEQWRQNSKRYMRLVAGIILLMLAYALWKNLI